MRAANAVLNGSDPAACGVRALVEEAQSYLGPSVGVGHADPTVPAIGLWPEEIAATGRMVDPRLREFAAGRAAARAAMSSLGIAPMAIPMAETRAPVWPTGLTGSITHSADMAFAAVSATRKVRAIGVDLEPATPLEEDLWDTVLTPFERAAQPTPIAAKRIFSAKEALYKAQHLITGQWLGFQDVEISLDGPVFTVGIGKKIPDMPPVLRGLSALSERHILSVLSLPNE